MTEDRLPPQNLEAEQSILGALLLDKDTIHKIMDILSPEMFYRDAHKYIFQSIIDLNEKSEPIDLITLSNQLKSKEQLDIIGGSYYLTQVINSVPTAANATYYAKIIEEKSVLRDMINAGSLIVEKAFDPSLTVADVIDISEKTVMDVSNRKAGDGFVNIKDILTPVMDQIESVYDNENSLLGVTSGFNDLDGMTSGFKASELIILAARPSMGKTAFCLNVAANCAFGSNTPVAIFSIEMSKESLVQRVLCAEAEIDASRLSTGNLHDNEWKKLTRAIGRLSEAPIFIDDTPALTVLELKAKARRLKAEFGLGMIIIDYMQLMSGSKGKKTESRMQEISEIARGLKAVARELEVPVMALSQLSRAVEQRPDKIPRLSDLRESGEIEQTADLVMFIHREDYYNNTGEEQTNMGKIIIAKQRNGPTGNIDLFFRKEITKFYNIEKRMDASEPY